MGLPRDRILKLKKLSYKFWKAIGFLDEKGSNNSDVLNIVNEKLAKDGIAFILQDFSKLSLLYKNNTYISGPAYNKLSIILPIVDDHILRNHNCEYSEHEKIYKLINEDTSNPRLSGIIGTYIGYTWHQAKEMVHVFKINIVSIHEILCDTLKAKFASQKMTLIDNSKVAIEMRSNLRSVFLILEIGKASVSELRQMKTFKVAYVDSGDTKTKCGLGIIERTDIPFSKLDKPTIKPLSSFEATKDIEFVNLIKGNQLTIK